MVKIGDFVSAGSRFNGCWNGCEVIRVLVDKSVRVINNEGLTGILNSDQYTLDKSEPTDEELAEKFRQARKDYYGSARELQDRGYKVGAFMSTVDAATVDKFIDIKKTVTTEIVL